MVFVVAALALAGVPQADMLPAALGLFVIAMLALGTGNGSVFQLVPQRFGRDRRDDRAGRHGGRRRRFLPRLLAGLRQAMQRQLFAGLPYLRGTGGGRAWSDLLFVKSRWRATRGAAEGVRSLVMTRTLILLLALAPAGAAHARMSSSSRLAKPARYEAVDQDGLAANAEALTLRCPRRGRGQGGHTGRHSSRARQSGDHRRLFRRPPRRRYPSAGSPIPTISPSPAPRSAMRRPHSR